MTDFSLSAFEVDIFWPDERAQEQVFQKWTTFQLSTSSLPGYSVTQCVLCRNLRDRHWQILFLVKDFTSSTGFCYAEHPWRYDPIVTAFSRASCPRKTLPGVKGLWNQLRKSPPPVLCRWADRLQQGDKSGSRRADAGEQRELLRYIPPPQRMFWLAAPSVTVDFRTCFYPHCVSSHPPSAGWEEKNSAGHGGCRAMVSTFSYFYFNSYCNTDTGKSLNLPEEDLKCSSARN